MPALLSPSCCLASVTSARLAEQEQGRKAEVLMNQTAAVGLSSGAVDYEKLRIENQQQSQHLRVCINELPRLRTSAGQVSQASPRTAVHASVCCA